MSRRWLSVGAGLAAMMIAAAVFGRWDEGRGSSRDPSPDVGKSYEVPYLLTDTNHYLVRVRINGKGPFNFLVDTGAPAIFVATETAKKAGLEPSKTQFWNELDRIDFEGGAYLTKPKCRIEDPFQLVGMNALGLPGASIDGILGFSALARFRITMDPKKDRMTWTRINNEPADPYVPKDVQKQAPAEVQAMNLLGPAMKMLSMFTGKQPETKRVARGHWGVELSETLKVEAIWKDSPAEKANLKVGDQIVKVRGRSVQTLTQLRESTAQVQPGNRTTITVQRGEKTQDLAVTAGEGL